MGLTLLQVGLSPALEMTAKYYLDILSDAVAGAGAALPDYISLLQQVLLASFDAPSSKVWPYLLDLVIIFNLYYSWTWIPLLQLLDLG